MPEYDKTVFSQNEIACNVQFYKRLWLDVVTSPNDSDIEVITVRLSSEQARELASMLIAGADIADGLPRPTVGEIPLSYVKAALHRQMSEENGADSEAVNDD